MVTHAPGWPEVHRTFFDWGQFRGSFPEISRAFLLNVKIFCISEALILVFALLLAVSAACRGPVFFPLRALAIAYTDFFRGVPTILVIALLGLGAPALGLSWVPTSVTFWGIVALTLVYTAYVSEVYRAGIESVHPSQEVAARSLGLTRDAGAAPRDPPAGGSARDPAAAERLHRAAEGHGARLDRSGAIEAFNQSQIDADATFNFTPYLAAAALFVAITIPLARFTDWLAARDRRARQLQGVR